MSHPRRAFTLLELLLAMTITVIVAGALATALFTAFRAKTSAEEAIEITHATVGAGDIITRDLTCAISPNGILAGSFVGDAQSLSFYTTGPEAKATVQGDCKLVEYVLKSDDSQSEQILVRHVTTNLLAPIQTEPVDERICRRVAAFTLRYFDGTAWIESWDSSQRDNTLPTGVEVTLELTPLRPNTDPPRTVRVVLLPCAPPPGSSSSTTGSTS